MSDPDPDMRRINRQNGHGEPIEESPKEVHAHRENGDGQPNLPMEASITAGPSGGGQEDKSLSEPEGASTRDGNGNGDGQGDDPAPPPPETFD